MKARLIIFKLKIKSSYNQNLEQPADDKFDTLQFFIQDQLILRIRTFVIDHDIHIYKVQLKNSSPDETIKFLISSTNEHYGDLVEKMIDLDLKDFKDYETIKSMLKKEKLSPHLDTPQEFTFWNPDNKKYKTQSNPM